MRTNSLLVAAGALVIIGFSSLAYFAQTDDPYTETSTTSVEMVADSQTTKPNVTMQGTTSSQLQYLIEEEKLAHDVYLALYDVHGTQIFANIARSETTHQERVFALLNDRSIADPRAEERGTFTNSELQRLYDTLVARGTKNLEAALQVGVTIEEMDIADITEQLKTTTDADITATLEALRSASENHLSAFQRQLS